VLPGTRLGRHEGASALRRRELLLLLGSLAAGAAWRTTRATAASRDAVSALQQLAAATAAQCVLTPEVTPGPYYIVNHLTRRNLTDGQPGLPLQLRLRVQQASTCGPIAGADVELWHANAAGTYSGDSRLFLRGHQKTDSSGLAVFDTIYPGWYPGRAPHIHVKVHAGGRVVHTGQLFFPDAVSRAVYRMSPYRSHGMADTSNSSDGIFRSAGASRAIVRLAQRKGDRGYSGSLTVGVRT
jgi:protocatechuate 3,4-dioxygenase beta subunit